MVAAYEQTFREMVDRMQRSGEKSGLGQWRNKRMAGWPYTQLVGGKTEGETERQ